MNHFPEECDGSASSCCWVLVVIEQRIRVICVPLCPEDGQDILQVEHNLTQVDAWKEVVAFPALGVNAVPLSSKGGSCGY